MYQETGSKKKKNKPTFDMEGICIKRLDQRRRKTSQRQIKWSNRIEEKNIWSCTETKEIKGRAENGCWMF